MQYTYRAPAYLQSVSAGCYNGNKRQAVEEERLGNVTLVQRDIFFVLPNQSHEVAHIGNEDVVLHGEFLDILAVQEQGHHAVLRAVGEVQIVIEFLVTIQPVHVVAHIL